MVTDTEWDKLASEVVFEEAEPQRFLLSIDDNYNVTFPDDLTLDEAKELLRRMAVMTLKIQKALMEMSRPVEATE